MVAKRLQPDSIATATNNRNTIFFIVFSLRSWASVTLMAENTGFFRMLCCRSFGGSRRIPGSLYITRERARLTRARGVRMGTKALGFGVISWAFWAPGKKQSRPDISFVPSLLRRRLSILSAGAMHVANTALQDERDIPVVFASRHGELGRTAAILEALAACEAPSPTAFSLSVHNTAA